MIKTTEEIYIDGQFCYDYVKKTNENDNVVRHCLFKEGTEVMFIISNGDEKITLSCVDKKQLTMTETEELHILLRLYFKESFYETAEPKVKKQF